MQRGGLFHLGESIVWTRIPFMLSSRTVSSSIELSNATLQSTLAQNGSLLFTNQHTDMTLSSSQIKFCNSSSGGLLAVSNFLNLCVSNTTITDIVAARGGFLYAATNSVSHIELVNESRLSVSMAQTGGAFYVEGVVTV